MDNTQLQIVITAKNQLQAGIASASAELNKLGIATSGVSTSQDKMTSSVFKGVAAWDIFKQAVGMAKGFITDTIKAASDAETQMMKFNGVMNSIGGNTESARNQILSYSQSLLNYGVDNEYAALQTAKFYKATGDVTKAQGLMTLALKLSASGYGDVEHNADNLSKILVGKGARAMLEYKVQVEKGMTTQEMFTAIQKKATTSIEDWANTTTAKTAIVNEKYNEVKEMIGGALLPVYNQFLNYSMKMLDWLIKDSEGANYFGKTLYGLGLYLTATGKVIWAIIQSLASWAAITIQNGYVIVAFGKDVIGVFKNIASAGQLLAKAIVEFFKGNFSGAKQYFNEAANIQIMTFKNTASEAMVMRELVSQEYGKITGAWKSAGQAADDALKLKGADKFKLDAQGMQQALVEMGDGYDNVNAGASKAQEESKKLTEAFDKLKTTFNDVKEKGIDSLQGISDKIAELTSQLTDLYSEKRGKQTEINTSYGEEYVKQEQKVADIQKELTDKQKEYNAAKMDKGDDILSINEKIATAHNELQVVQDKFDKESAVLQKYSYLATQYANEVKDARIVANNTEFENALETLRKKQDSLEIEFAGKKFAIEAELKAEAEKFNQVAGFLEQAFTAEKDFNNQRVKATVETVNAQIEYYNKLAKAISDAQSGKMSGKVSAIQVNKNLELSGSAYRVNPINITINAGNIVGANAGKELGNMIVNALKDNMKLP
jgi:hypothetical protein